MKRIQSLATGLMFAAALLMHGCGKEEPPKPAPKAEAPPPAETIVKIGVASPLTGPQAHIGIDIKNGVQLAVEGAPIVQKCLERGLLINCTHQTVIRLLPALTIADEQIDVSFRVTNLSAERRSAVRDVALQLELANLPSERYGVTGKAYETSEVGRMVEEIFVPDETESFPERIALWNTWFAFWLIIDRAIYCDLPFWLIIF